jgi:hypothetical protein
VLIPVEADVLKLVTLLFVELSAVDKESTPLCAVLMLVENPPTVVDTAATVLTAELTVVDIDATVLVAELMLVDHPPTIVDSDDTLLLFVLNPVDNEVTALLAVLIPDEVDVLRLVRLVLVLAMLVLASAIPVEVEIDRLFRLVLVFEIPVAVETDRLYNSLPVTPSVEPEAILPSAIRVILRVSPLEALPTLTTLAAPASELP